MFLIPAGKAANNIVVVCQLHYINTLKQELNNTKADKETSADEKTVVNSHSNDLPYKFAVVVVLGFYVSPTAKVIRRRDLGSKSHPKDCISLL